MLAAADHRRADARFPNRQTALDPERSLRVATGPPEIGRSTRLRGRYGSRCIAAFREAIARLRRLSPPADVGRLHPAMPAAMSPSASGQAAERRGRGRRMPGNNGWQMRAGVTFDIVLHGLMRQIRTARALSWRRSKRQSLNCKLIDSEPT